MIHESVFVDPMARVMGDVVIGEGSAVLYGTIIRGDDDRVIIGNNTVILENSLIEAPVGKPVIIGDNVLVSHAAIIHGARVSNGALVGIGAIVLDEAVIGENAIIAAGAVVPPGKTVPAETIVAGVPAKPVRKVNESDLSMVRRELQAVLRKVPVYKSVLGGVRQPPPNH